MPIRILLRVPLDLTNPLLTLGERKMSIEDTIALMGTSCKGCWLVQFQLV